jgi:hypothetical protein
MAEFAREEYRLKDEITQVDLQWRCSGVIVVLQWC